MKVAYIEQCAILCVPCLSICRRFEQAREHLWRRRSCTQVVGSTLVCMTCSLQCHTGGVWIKEVSQRWIVDFAQRVLAVFLMLLPLGSGHVGRHGCPVYTVCKDRFVLQYGVAQGSAEVACVELLRKTWSAVAFLEWIPWWQ